jgi:23S rRNA (cytidine1920-2'-O)/16S rRNA (cytidine1409-2'-O)-methyltransferase
VAGKTRLDVLLAERGLAESRSLAQRLILAGQVRVNGSYAARPGQLVDPKVELLVEASPAFVSRGGEKLAAALDSFPILVSGKTCADIGASTGGFTDCLLQHGAAKVYAIDVGRGILHWKVRNDPRVICLEGVNARYLEGLPEPIDLVTIDASFISLAKLLPPACRWMTERGELVALVKPQFEAGRADVGRGGVVRDPATHRRVVAEVLAAMERSGLAARGLLRSPLLGPKGNVEFLVWADRGPPVTSAAELLEQFGGLAASAGE